MLSSPTAMYFVALPSLGFCDVHARYDASGIAWLGCYDRGKARWYTSTDRTLTLDLAVEALHALGEQS